MLRTIGLLAAVWVLASCAGATGSIALPAPALGVPDLRWAG
jgi:hypothetical protein